MIKADTATAAAYWASYLVNGDDSGLEESEKALADAWLAKLAPAYVVSCEGESYFSWGYGAITGSECSGGDLLEYVIHVPVPSAYLHFGKGDEPRQTVNVEARETALPRTRRPLHGYGARIATEWLVLWAGRWRRVYAACYGNSPSLYIGPSGDWLATVDVERVA